MEYECLSNHGNRKVPVYKKSNICLYLKSCTGTMVWHNDNCLLKSITLTLKSKYNEIFSTILNCNNL